MIDDLDNYCQSSCVFSVGEEHHTSNLDQPPLRGVDLDVCHTDRTTAECVISFISGSGMMVKERLLSVDGVAIAIIEMRVFLSISN